MGFCRDTDIDVVFMEVLLEHILKASQKAPDSSLNIMAMLRGSVREEYPPVNQLPLMGFENRTVVQSRVHWMIGAV